VDKKKARLEITKLGRFLVKEGVAKQSGTNLLAKIVAQASSKMLPPSLAYL
jgi:hypothetical protein